MLPRVVRISVRRLRTRRYPALLRSPRPGRHATTTKVVTAVSGMQSGCRRCTSGARRRAPAHKVVGVCCGRARRATPGPSKLSHRDHFAGANRVECLRDRPSVRVVVSRVWFVAVGLVGIEVGKRRDGVWVWWELGCRVGCRGRISDRVSLHVESSVEAGSTRTVCW